MTASPQSDTISVERLDDWRDVAALGDEWSSLAVRSNRPSVFLSHEWFDAAWKWRSREATLAVLVARRGPALVGALPLITRMAPSRFGKRRAFEALSVPDTQEFDLLVVPEVSAAVCKAIAGWLCSTSAWDMVDIAYLSERSTIVTGLVPALRTAGITTTVEDGGVNPFIALDEPWDAFYSGRTRSLKKANNLAANRLRKAGNITIDVYREGAESPGNVTADLVPVLAGISGRSWKRDTGNSLDFPGPHAFIRRLTELSLTRGWLSVWVLRLDGKPLAMEYQLAFNGAVHALRADFDADYSEISPGSHLFRELLEKLFGMGLRRYYMGPGDNAYKQRWTDKAEPLRRVRGYSRSGGGRLAAILDLHVLPVARAMRDRFAPAKTDLGARADEPAK